MAVPVRLVVEQFDVVEYIGPLQIPRFINPLADTLLFQTAKERLRHGIIPAVSSPAHAWIQVIGFAETPPVIAVVRGTSGSPTDRAKCLQKR